jgi:hypothetical protein
MIQRTTQALLLTGAALLLGAPAVAAPDLPPAGTVAPEIAAKTWYNHLGKNPDLESLRGKAILLEFWATW